MTYKAIIRGRVHALESIVSPSGYARGTFVNVNDVTYEQDKQDSRVLNFTVRRVQLLEGTASLGDFQEGLIQGDDTNIEWSVSFQKTLDN